MLSTVFRGNTFTTQKVLQWAGCSQRCWTSSRPGAANGALGSLVARRAVTQKCSAAFTRTEPLPRTPATASFVMNHQYHSSPVRLKKRSQPEPPPRELDLLRYDMKDLKTSPKPALCLGFAGLIPFVTPTLFMAVTESYLPDLAFAQVAYGASILSFLGGARWGFSLPESSPAQPDWINLTNSVIPSLLAWVAMLMADSIVSAGTMVIMGLGISLHYDLSLLPTYPSWFKALRAVLTLVAFFSLVGTLTMSGIFPEKKMFNH